MNARRSRQYRRTAQACETCRRKKIRCPGERPRCSACTRLRQQCSFADNDYIDEQTASGIESRMAVRLMQLEDKLDSIIGRIEPQSMQEATPSSASGRIVGMLSDSPAITQASPLSSNSLPRDIIARAIEVYFRHIHRQPLWLFEKESLPAPGTCEELICVILALSISYNAGEFTDGNLRSPDFYSKTARRLIMLKIADGAMSFQSTQALCLLAFFNLISGDLPLAGFNTGLAKSFTQYSALQHDPNSPPTSQEQSKLFWSIYFLSTFCGPPALVPSIAEDVGAPRFSTLEARHSFTPCPLLPQESHVSERNSLPGVWSHSLRICSLWGDIRLYISRCIEGFTKCPWQPDSDYTILCSRLLELEIKHPTSLSYNSVKFLDRLPQEVQSNRLDWLPWLRVQVTYHAVHCVLNHPFLYSVMAKAPRQKLGANTFWRASYEKALRHCTWISRLIRMAGEKGLQIADPFFAQAAAIASTLHLYWTRTSDTQLQASSLENLGICRRLITEMAAHSPVCRIIEKALDQFVHLVNSSSQANDSEYTPMTAKTSLIWILLDVAAPQFPSYSDDGTRGRDGWSTGHGNEEQTILPRSEMHTPPTDMRESTAHYASPPAWLSSRTACAGSPTGTSTRQEEAESLVHGLATSVRDVTGDLAWGAWEHLMTVGENSMTGLDWWDLDNL
ncbi:hypothetical protein B0T10DRAFT_540596 [Thelonectria olida]|uniref:Zn(2)-C6 fungal-type domain-containing protein n=1 Tax=Thelonectria olida TaxID=1576542 RepID=A0A9P8VVS8_9HYPO|nr:hypothetical protein B0T10DRAFT_540596 [Thelonectria olida]